MISQEIYQTLLKKYGSIASWAVWKESESASKPKSNMRDVDMFDDMSILNTLNPNFIFVGLNGSGKHDDYMDFSRPWFNFHSSSPRGNDFKLRFAIKETHYWGSYITDIIKNFPEVDSNKVGAYIKSHPEILRENIALFKEELDILGGNPTIIAIGNKSYDILSKEFGTTYTVKHIMHYSYTISKEKYREKVLSQL